METYYNPADLANFSGEGVGAMSPELWEKFMGYYGSVFQDGALTSREKSLIALAVAAAVQCPYCIDAYTNWNFCRPCRFNNFANMSRTANIARI